MQQLTRSVVAAAAALFRRSGDKVPADLRLVVCKTATLRAEQSSLTGEPQAVLKGVEAVGDANCELQVGATDGAGSVVWGYYGGGGRRQA